MMCVILMIVGLVAGLLSGSVGFGGGMILLPVITYFYGVEVACRYQLRNDDRQFHRDALHQECQ